MKAIGKFKKLVTQFLWTLSRRGELDKQLQIAILLLRNAIIEGGGEQMPPDLRIA